MPKSGEKERNEKTCRWEKEREQTLLKEAPKLSKKAERVAEGCHFQLSLIIFEFCYYLLSFCSSEYQSPWICKWIMKQQEIKSTVNCQASFPINGKCDSAWLTVWLCISFSTWAEERESINLHLFLWFVQIIKRNDFEDLETYPSLL